MSNGYVKMIAVGNLGGQAEVRQVGDTSVCNFSVACSDDWTSKSGEKKEEYRDISKHWIRRLIGNDPNDGGFYHFDTVTFTNGYAKDAPRFEIELIDINRRGGHVEWGAVAGQGYFVLSLGDIIEDPFTMPVQVDCRYQG